MHKSRVLKVRSCSAASYSYFRQCATPNVSGTVMAPFPKKAHRIAITQILEVKFLFLLLDPFLKDQVSLCLPVSQKSYSKKILEIGTQYVLGE